MNQAKPTHPQNIYEICKKWFISLFQRPEHQKTANTDILAPEDRPVLATEQESPNTETRASHPRHQTDVYKIPPQPAIIATQFQGAHSFKISGTPTFTNIGVNNEVNNVNTVNNHAGAHVDNRDQQSYNITVDTQYGDTNIGDNQRNGGGTYNFKGNH